MRITLSGFEGVGKTTTFNNINSNFTKMIEPARFLIDFKKNINEDKNELSYTALLINFYIYENIINNNIHNLISDRNIIDDITYLKIYKDQNIDLVKINEQLNSLLDKNEQDYLFDYTYLLLNTEDKDFIQKKILSDKDRKYCDTPEKYIYQAKIWNESFFYYYLQIERFSKNIIFVSPYSDLKLEIESKLI